MSLMFVCSDEEERQKFITEALITRINTREASTLVFSTITASASLIFLAAIFQGTISPEWREPMKWSGFLFSLLGPIYREITIHTSDRIDYQVLRTRLGEPLPSPHWFWIICRGSILRFFLCLPIIGWLVIPENSACFSILLVLALITSAVLSVVELLSRDP